MCEGHKSLSWSGLNHIKRCKIVSEKNIYDGKFHKNRLSKHLKSKAISDLHLPYELLQDAYFVLLMSSLKKTKKSKAIFLGILFLEGKQLPLHTIFRLVAIKRLLTHRNLLRVFNYLWKYT
jgi:hypothetical protein